MHIAPIVAFAQAGGGVVDSESVRTTEGKVPHHGQDRSKDSLRVV